MFLRRALTGIHLREEVQEVYLHEFLHRLGLSLVTIFIPLYLLEGGFSIVQLGIFYFAFYFFNLFVTFPAYHISGRIGYKKTVLISAPFLVGYYFLLRSFSSPELLYLSTFAGALGKSLYWAGMNPETAFSTHDDSRDTEVGIFMSMPAFASVISPFIGGLVLAFSGFNTLFLVTALFVGLSYVPLYLTRDHSDGMEMSFRDFLSRDFGTDFLTYFFNGVESIGKKLLWPLFLVLIIGGSVDIGLAGSLKALGAALASIAIGRITDDSNRGQVVLSGVLLAVAMFIVLYNVTSPLYATVLSFFFGLGRTAITMSAFEKSLENSEKEDHLEYFAFRGTALNLGRLSMIAVIIGTYLWQETLLLSVAAMCISITLFGYFLIKMSNKKHRESL